MTRSLRLAPLLAAIVLATVTLPASTALTPTVSGNNLWYYEIGGASAISPPPNRDFRRVTISAGAELKAGYSCGKFDAVLSVTNILNNIAHQAEHMVDAMVAAANAAIASLPAYVLQRANPGLYDLFQNALLKAEETVNLTTKTCEDMEAEIAASKDPYREWAVLSKGNDWKMVMGTQNDIVQAKRDIEKDNGKNGVPWIGGERKGGEGQNPIKVIGDTMEAGYDITLNQGVGKRAEAPGALDDGLLATVSSSPTAKAPKSTAPTAQPRIQEIWPTAKDARDWVVSVVGEKEVTTCDDCPKDTTPGMGLLLLVDKDAREVEKTLRGMVNGELPLMPEQLEKIGAPGIGINTQLVQEIQRLPLVDRSFMVKRLALEIATARILERALYARRLLLTGSRVPEVQAAGAAREDLKEAIAEIEREVDGLAFEKKVRQEMVSETAARFLRWSDEQSRRLKGVPRREQPDPNRLEYGEVREDPGK